MSDLHPLLQLPPQRLTLLKALAEEGSISAAARSAGVSYKTAWDWIDNLNNLASEPLLTRSTGGKGGGGSQLTDYGRALIDGLEQLQLAQQQLAAVSENFLSQPQHLSDTLRRMTLKTSARNQLAGTVTAITPGAVNTLIGISLGGDDSLRVQITNDSVALLELSPGAPVIALIKANAPMLVDCTGAKVQTSAVNRLAATVENIQPGAVNAEVNLRLSSGRSLTAIIELSTLETLALTPGKHIEAWISPAHILLATGF
ncbi:TOBE domain-containing protein [Pokkaliibacter sp. CJK22405]|uniref:TOBE domain-containing protein n=1 Tax=Pokkaliibacter sp. CJK22405 TaxID=3384615 RepID=UPI003984D8A0